MLENPNLAIFQEVLRFNLESITAGVVFKPPDRRGETPRPNGPDHGQAAAARPGTREPGAPFGGAL